MSNMSNYQQNRLIRAVSRSTTLSTSSVYIGLMITPGGQFSAGAEPTDAAYARQLVTFSEPVRDREDASYMVVTNTTDIVFPAAETSWGTIPYFGLFSSAQTNANLLFYGELQERVKVCRWDTVVIPAGSLSIRLG